MVFQFTGNFRKISTFIFSIQMYRAAFAPESMIIMIFAFVRINPFRLQINIINKIDLFCCCSTSDYPTPYISNDSSSGKGDGGRRHWHVRVSYTFWLCISNNWANYIYMYMRSDYFFSPRVVCVSLRNACRSDTRRMNVSLAIQSYAHHHYSYP